MAIVSFAAPRAPRRGVCQSVPPDVLRVLPPDVYRNVYFTTSEAGGGVARSATACPAACGELVGGGCLVCVDGACGEEGGALERAKWFACPWLALSSCRAEWRPAATALARARISSPGFETRVLQSWKGRGAGGCPPRSSIRDALQRSHSDARRAPTNPTLHRGNNARPPAQNRAPKLAQAGRGGRRRRRAATALSDRHRCRGMGFAEQAGAAAEAAAAIAGRPSGAGGGDGGGGGRARPPARARAPPRRRQQHPATGATASGGELSHQKRRSPLPAEQRRPRFR